MVILGISAYYHDSAACIVKDGLIIAAAQEERFSRVKHDPSFPAASIKFCIEYAKLSPDEIDHVVFYDKPFLKFERLVETYLAQAPNGFNSFKTTMPLWISDKLFQKKTLVDELSLIFGTLNIEKKLLFSEHHLSHAASAFFPSPFEHAAVLTMDGVGEWTTTSISSGALNTLEAIKEINFPHSLGLLYSAFTYFTGFKVNSGEYKMMGLAPFGNALYVDLIKSHLIDINDDGSYHLNLDYFDFCSDLRMTSQKFHDLFGRAPRSAESLITQNDMDIAASIQAVVEEVVIKLGRHACKLTGAKNLCLAGGVALNCVANGKLAATNIFQKIWIQPAAGDAGGAIGAALAVYYLMLKKPRILSPAASDGMSGSYLGPEYSQDEVNVRLDLLGAVYEVLTERDLISKVSDLINEGAVIGWHQGRMEFGPRSLGARSIIADARSPKAQKNINHKIKFRESFRPFAPCILIEDVSDWFEWSGESPYMLMVGNIKKDKRLSLICDQAELLGFEKLNITRSTIPAVTHVDYSARIQTVSNNTNPKFYALLKAFKEKTGCPVLVNTSFNIRGEPIVSSPEDAYRCFMGTQIDYLVIGNSILNKKDQPSVNIKNYKSSYDLD